MAHDLTVWCIFLDTGELSQIFLHEELARQVLSVTRGNPKLEQCLVYTNKINIVH